MDSWIIVVDHPYHAVADEDGTFAISNVPVGTYTVTCWQEMLGEQTVEIVVAADEPATLDFEYPPSRIR